MGYLQVTTCCNFSCAHCCMNYGNGKRGRHMKWDTFIGAMWFMLDYEDSLTLGGGEPTLNPLFKRMVRYILENTGMSVVIITNGSNTKVMDWLIEELSEGIWENRLAVRLSWDEFHDTWKVEPRIYEYFRNKGLLHGYLRDKIQPIGRGKTLENYEFSEDHCPGSDITVYPDGRITACSCKDSPTIGHVVFHGYSMDIPDWDELPHDDDRCFSPSNPKIQESVGSL